MKLPFINESIFDLRKSLFKREKFSYLYILRGFRNLIIVFFSIRNTPKLINQQLKNGVKIVNW